MPRPRFHPTDIPVKYDTPSDYSQEALEKALSRIRTELENLRKLEEAVIEQQFKIDRLWQDTPALRVRKWIACTFRNRNGIQCGNPTQDRFGNRAICDKHIAGGDAALRAIMEDVIHGKD